MPLYTPQERFHFFPIQREKRGKEIGYFKWFSRVLCLGKKWSFFSQNKTDKKSHVSCEGFSNLRFSSLGSLQYSTLCFPKMRNSSATPLFIQMYSVGTPACVLEQTRPLPHSQDYIRTLWHEL